MMGSDVYFLFTARIRKKKRDMEAFSALFSSISGGCQGCAANMFQK